MQPALLLVETLLPQLLISLVFRPSQRWRGLRASPSRGLWRV